MATGNMVGRLLLTIATLSLLLATPARAFPEKHYQEAWCQEHGGQAEVVLADGTRADCIISEEGYAVEFDFAKGKWYEGITQSLYYSMVSGLKPGLVLIVKSPNETRFVDQARRLVQHYNLEIKIWVIEGYQNGKHQTNGTEIRGLGGDRERRE